MNVFLLFFSSCSPLQNACRRLVSTSVVDVGLGTAQQECGYLSRVRMRLSRRGRWSRSTILRTIKPDSALKAIFPVASLDMLKMAGYVSKHLS